MKKLILFIAKIFQKKKYVLKSAREYKKELKRKSKNQLIKIIIDLQTKMSIKGLPQKKKAAKAMIKHQKKRTKILKNEMAQKPEPTPKPLKKEHV